MRKVTILKTDHDMAFTVCQIVSENKIYDKEKEDEMLRPLSLIAGAYYCYPVMDSEYFEFVRKVREIVSSNENLFSERIITWSENLLF